MCANAHIKAWLLPLRLPSGQVKDESSDRKSFHPFSLPSALCVSAQTTIRLSRILIGRRLKAMLWTILVILVILWLLGLLGHIGGNLIHILLVVAVIVLIFNLVSGRRAV
jgi:Family of unknown function (DUF5670)